MDDRLIDEFVAQLAEVLPEEDPESLLEAVLETGSVEAGLEYILRRRQESLLIAKVEDVFRDLSSMFPRVERAFLISVIVGCPDATVDELIDQLIAQLTQKRQNNKYKRIVAPTGSTAQLQKGVSFAEAIKDVGAERPDCQRSSSPGRQASPPAFAYSFGLDDVEETAEDSQYYRQKAHELQAKRAAIYAKAADAFQRGGITGRGYAGYLSEEGHCLDGLVAKYTAMAARAAFRAHNSSASLARSVDLHGLTVREVEPLVHAFLRHHLVEGRSESVAIITGHGRGSAAGARLRPAVYGLLCSTDFFFSFDNLAVFTVHRRARLG